MKIKQNSLGINAILNTVKQGCAILFPFITFMYATRIFGAELVGRYSFGKSIVDYFGLLASLGISNYAVREGAKIRDDRKKMIKFSSEIFSINVCTTVISYILLVTVLCISSKLLNYEKIIIIQGLTILLTTLGVDWLNVVYEDYLNITIRYIAVQLICIIALFLFIREQSDFYVYTFIATMATAGGNIINWFYIRKRIPFKFTLSMNWIEHFIPVMIMFGNSLASVIYLNSDISLLGYLLDDYKVGVYTVASKIYSMVKTLINAAIVVTVPHFSNLLASENKSKYNNMLNIVFQKVIILVLPMSVGLYMEAPNIIAVVAGSEYKYGVASLRILCFAILLAVGACFFSYAILLPNQMEKYFLYSTIAAACVNILLNLFLIPRYGIEGAAVTTFLAEGIVLIMCMYFGRKFFLIKISGFFLLFEVIGCVLIICFCRLISNLNWKPLYELIISIAGSIFIYFFVLMMARYVNKKSLK